MSREKEIIDALAELSANGQRKFSIGTVEHWVRKNASQPIREHWHVIARQVLRTLSEIGFVEPGSYQDIVVTNIFLDSAPAKEARARLQENSQQSATGDGRRNRPPGGDGPNLPGDAGGDGFREVLAHPYLFALSDKEFIQLLDEI